MTRTEQILRDEWRGLRARYPDKLLGCDFVINGRFTRRLGCCRWLPGSEVAQSVEVAKSLTLDPALREQAVDTLLHEVAHALTGPHGGHGEEWKIWCRKLGCKPERLADLTTEERQVWNEVNPARYRVECLSCRKTFYRTRANATTKRHGRHKGCPGGLRWSDKRTGETFVSGREYKQPPKGTDLLSEFFPSPSTRRV